MIVPPGHSVASIPSSLTFRRLASYHSIHSPPPPPSGTNVGFGGFNLAAQGIIIRSWTQLVLKSHFYSIRCFIVSVRYWRLRKAYLVNNQVLFRKLSMPYLSTWLIWLEILLWPVDSLYFYSHHLLDDMGSPFSQPWYP